MRQFTRALTVSLLVALVACCSVGDCPTTTPTGQSPRLQLVGATAGTASQIAPRDVGTAFGSLTTKAGTGGNYPPIPECIGKPGGTADCQDVCTDPIVGSFAVTDVVVRLRDAGSSSAYTACTPGQECTAGGASTFQSWFLKDAGEAKRVCWSVRNWKVIARDSTITATYVTK